MEPAVHADAGRVVALVAVADVHERLPVRLLTPRLHDEPGRRDHELHALAVRSLDLVLALELPEVQIALGLVLRIGDLLRVLHEHLLELRVLERGLELGDLIGGELQILQVLRRLRRGVHRARRPCARTNYVVNDSAPSASSGDRTEPADLILEKRWTVAASDPFAIAAAHASTRRRAFLFLARETARRASSPCGAPSCRPPRRRRRDR